MKIFISYNSKNRLTVERLVTDLEMAGYDVWLDRELPAGEWWANILEQIRQRDVFMPALTTWYLKSEACTREYEYALALSKNILPVQLVDVNFKSLPSILQKLEIIDYRQADKKQALALVKALNKLPAPKPLPASLPPEPEIPLSQLAALRDLTRSKTLDKDQQHTLISQLEDYLFDEESGDSAWEVLEEMEGRDYLLKTIGDKIDALKIRRSKEVRPKHETLILEPRTFLGHRATCSSVAFLPDGRHVVSGSHDFTARLWDALTGDMIREFIGHDDAVTSVAVSPDGKSLLTGGQDKTGRLWNLKTGEHLLTFKGHKDFVTSVAFSPDGMFVLTGSKDKTAYLWDCTTGEVTQQYTNHNGDVLSVAFSLDGETVLTGSADKIARLWNRESGEQVGEFVGHRDYIRSVAFAPNASHVLTGSDDKTIRLWDISTCKLVRPFIGSSDYVYSVAFSSDGNHILSCSRSSDQVTLWDVSTGDSTGFKSNRSVNAIYSIAFSPNEGYVVAGGENGAISLWVSGINR
ncbi:MAG: TIR domain-containing protein [Chloroflexota bacterium]